MGNPDGETPIGRYLWDVVTAISREFEATLAEAGGSRPLWFVLLALIDHPGASQREIAERVGVQDATLTHHLNAMEEAGLIRRYRASEDRRVQRIELTTEGHALFDRVRTAAMDFDRRLREGVPEEDLALLRETLSRMLANVAGKTRVDPTVA
ncbi:MAG TPA: MarR family transcriptional regulator [Acidimicrobiia bacterium]